MSAQKFAMTFTAGQTVRLPAGRFFFINAATAALDVRTAGNTSSPASFLNIGAGTKFGPVQEGQGWRFLDVTSATAQNVEITISDDGQFEVASTVNVAGNVTTTVAPSVAIASPADVAIAATTTDVASIPQNVSRRRVTVGVLSTAAGPVRVSANGATGRGIEVQPGTFVEFVTTAALGIRNDGAAGTSFYFFEET